MRAIVLSTCLVLAAGCVSHVPMSADYAGPVPPAPLAAQAPQAPVVLSADRPVKERAGFTVRHLTLPSNVAARDSIELEYYDIDGAERTPIVMLLPIFNGQLIVTRYFARYFANQGWAALIVVREREPLTELGEPEPAIRANLADYRRVLDWVEQLPDIDTARIGLFGISFGAMDAVMLMALDSRVDALVAAMAGGDLAYLLMNTNYRPIARAINGMLDDTGQSRAGLLATLEQRITTDPLALAPYVDAARVLLIMTRSDAIVPFEAQQALRARLGAPETLYLPTGHRPSVLFFPKLRASAYEFLARQFQSPRVAVAH